MSLVTMAPTADNTTTRFSNRVADYVRYRPSYPPEVILCLQSEFGLAPGQVVAEIGSGTGIFTELLLAAGCTLYAVEPNAKMRAAAEVSLSKYPAFHSVNGSAEATTLPDAGVNWLMAAQAFHWFDVPKARTEALRILHSPAMAALLWNNRREDTPFLESYERFLHTFSIDYARIKHQNAEADGRIPQFFGSHVSTRCSFVNAQTCDFDALKGRTLSASYIPAADHPRHAEMIDSLKELFEAHATTGTVTIEYETRLYVGQM